MKFTVEIRRSMIGFRLRDATPFTRWMSARRERRVLATLSAERLDHLGLTRDEAQREAARPIWDPPIAPR